MKKPCTHPDKKDLTQGIGKERNHFCPTCDMHWYRGRTWTKAEWAEYVEDFSEDKSKYFPKGKVKLFFLALSLAFVSCQEKPQKPISPPVKDSVQIETGINTDKMEGDEIQ